MSGWRGSNGRPGSAGGDGSVDGSAVIGGSYTALAPCADPRQGGGAQQSTNETRRISDPNATQVLRDQRLTPSARALAGILVALAGKADHVDLTRGDTCRHGLA